MTISRSKNKDAYGFDLSLGVPWAYAANGGAISTFVATNANPNNKIGATYRVHKFTSIGAQSIFFDRAGLVDVFVVAGGGQGGGATGANQGGGGGAGGVLVRYEQYVAEGQSMIFVGAGGTSSTTISQNGQNSYFNQHLAIGGGRGSFNIASDAPDNGGSGGGAGAYNYPFGSRGTPNQGFGGGYTLHNGVNGGGGGAGKPGGSVNVLSTDRPNGGDGLQIAFENNTPTYYAGGGVGGVRGTYTSPLPTGGLGGGGNLGGTPGTDWNGGAASFYGGGGGGAARPTNSSQQIGGAGYQGIVIIRYIVNLG